MYSTTIVVRVSENVDRLAAERLLLDAAWEMERRLRSQLHDEALEVQVTPRWYVERSFAIKDVDDAPLE